LSRLQSLFRSDEIDPESRNRFLLIAGMVSIVVLALALIGYGYYVDRVKPRGETVIVVGERNYSYAYLENRAQAAYQEGNFNLQDPAFAIAQLVSDIQNEELTRLLAAQEGLTATTEEIEARMREDLDINPESPRTNFAAALRIYLQDVGLSLASYEEIVEARVLDTELKNLYSVDIQPEQEQINLSLIQAPTDSEAVAARQRILDGEDFGEVAMDVSEGANASFGGAYGWVPRDLLNADLVDAAFALEPGSTSEIVEVGSGFYILKVDGKETREITPEQVSDLASRYFNEKLDEADAEYQPENLLTVGQAQELVGSIGG
jgi:parvulin-like peptidyl-prolyl isomerase